MTYLWAAFILAASVLPASAITGGSFSGKTDEEIVSSIDAAVANRKVTPAYSSSLVKALGDNEAGVRVRERAAWALGELGVKSAVPALIKAADHKGLLIRSAAVTALTRLRPSTAVPVFLKIAETDPILPMRQRAVIALGLFRSDKAIQPLVQLSSDPAPELRGAAALAMASTHSKKNDFRELLTEMTADENPYVRERAERGLEIAQGKTGDVLNQLKSSDSDIRLTAALYFDQKGSARELSALKDAWNTEPDEDVRDQLSRAIISSKSRAQQEKARREKAAKEKAAAAAATKKGSETK